MYKFIRPLLFGVSKDPETVHNMALYFLKLGGYFPISSIIGSFCKIDNPSLKQKIFGLDFKNPLGLAAGFDKDGKAMLGLQALGFGFLEIGTVTGHAQPGNPRQRLFRLEKDQALINRMGFNNQGPDVLANTLSSTLIHPCMSVPVGISLGKSKITNLEKAAEDYLYSFKKLYGFGDYFVINVSSPNTPGLRQLQDKHFLVDIISGLNKYRNDQQTHKPLLVKIAPDLSFEAINEVLEVCGHNQVDGIIATNTTISREGLETEINEAGGLSGKPLKEKSTIIIKYIHKQMPGLPIIGVGGIFNGEDAYEKIKAGASLVQIYTGLIYEGPGLVKKINQGLVKLLQRDGFKNIGEAVGVESQ